MNYMMQLVYVKNVLHQSHHVHITAQYVINAF